MKKNPPNKKNKQPNKQLSNKNSQSSKKKNQLNNQSSHRLNNKDSKPNHKNSRINHKNNRINHKNKQITSANKQSKGRNKHQNKKKQNKQLKKTLSNRKKQNSQHAKQLGFLALTQDIVFKSFFSRNKPVLISLLKSFLPITNPITNITILNPEIRDKQNNHPNPNPNPKTENKNQARSNKLPQLHQKSVQTLNNLHSFLKEEGDSRSQRKDGFKDLNKNPSKKEQLNQLSLKESSVYPNPVNKKQIVLDLRVKLSSGENINVEMQTINQKHLLKRILFYWAKLYSQDLEKGENYNKIHPAYSLIFTTFPVLDQQITSFMSSFSIRRDIKPHQLFNKDLKIVIVELSKLKKPYDKLLDLKEKWCYILRDSSKITKQEYISLSEDEEMKMALRHLNRLSKEEELYQEALTEKINQVAYDLDRAGLLEEGMERGLEKGRVEGIEKGRVEGMEKGRVEIALNMLKEGFKAPAISKVTGLSIEEIAKLEK